ncbi:hypothetical protein ACVIKP_007773 [Rhizobium leguminosarum]
MASPVAMAKIRCGRMPISPAVTGSSEVARKARPTARAIDQLVETDDDGDRRKEGHQRHDAGGDGAQIHGGAFEAAGKDAAAIGGKTFEQAVLDDDRQAEGDEQRRQDILAERAVEQEILQAPTDGEHQRHRYQGGNKRVEPECRHQHQDQEGGKHDQVAMGEVDQPHNAEDETEPRCKQRIEPAEQHALENGIKPAHGDPSRNRPCGCRGG